jgi:RNA polymerase sigma-70 factor, ECF subfamily
MRTWIVLVDTRPDLNDCPGAGDDSTKEPIRPLEEENLVSSAQAGDAEAFCALVAPHLRQIYLRAARITRNHADAEDASQECLVKAFLHIHTFRNHSRFSTWLTRIAINESLMRVRKRKAELRHVLCEKDFSEISSLIQLRDRKSSSNPEAFRIQKERNDLLREAVGQLGPELRLTVQLFGTGEMRSREIGHAIQLSQSAVKARLRGGLRKLRGILTHKLGGRGEPIRGWI